MQYSILVCMSAASRVDGCDRVMALAQRRSVSHSIKRTTGSDASGVPLGAPRRLEGGYWREGIPSRGRLPDEAPSATRSEGGSGRFWALSTSRAQWGNWLRETGFGQLASEWGCSGIRLREGSIREGLIRERPGSGRVRPGTTKSKRRVPGPRSSEPVRCRTFLFDRPNHGRTRAGR